MLKLRILLLSSWIYIFILCLAIIYTLISNVSDYSSKYNVNDTKFEFYIDKIEIDGNKLNMMLIGKEKVVGSYYFEKEKDLIFFKNNIELGDKLEIVGVLSKPNNSTVPNTFDYNNYLKSKRIDYILEIGSYRKIEDNKKVFYLIKNLIIKRINSFKSSSYINAFVLGDIKNINKDINKAYQNNGISHLLAISGGNISFFSVILLFIFKKLGIYEDKRYIITSFILLFYMLLVGCMPSIVRAVLFFSLLSINKIYYFNIKTINIFYLTLVIVLFSNPFIIYDIGFQFSFMISFYLLLFQEYLLSNKNYIVSLFRISLISFLASLPIVINNFYQINLLSIIYNIFFVPFVSIIVFPLSILTFIFKCLDPVMGLMIFILEKSSLFFNSIDIGKIILSRPNIIFIVVYYFLSLLVINGFKKKNYMFLIVYILVIFFHYNKNYFINNSFMIMIDVGTGDSILFYSNNEAMLIDTGGSYSFVSEDWEKKDKSSIYQNKLEPLFKSLGIRKINYLLLTHGDIDHVGEAFELVDKYKVDKVIFNSNQFNSNENKLIDILKTKEIYFCKDGEGDEYKVGNFKFTSINTNLIEENDSSIVLYTKIFDKKLLLMGDASVKSEKYILDNYELGNFDLLKVGHHGSKTSTGVQLLNSINPNYAIISVGLNNKFNHPSGVVIERLKNYNIKYYMTMKDGSIWIDFKNKMNFKFSNK